MVEGVQQGPVLVGTLFMACTFVCMNLSPYDDPVTMNSPFLHCMWSDRNSRLSVTHACKFFSFSQGWTLFGPVLLPCGPVDYLYPS